MTEYKCPDCGSIGEHEHPTTGVRSCENCAYCAGVKAFEKQGD